MRITIRVDAFQKIFINLMFWLSFGLVIFIVNWAKVDFNLDVTPKFPELEGLIQFKQFFLMLITGFCLYGLLSFFFRKAKTDDEHSRRRHYISLALSEWSSVFVNFGSIVAIVSGLVGNWWYLLGTLTCYVRSLIIVDQ